VRFRSRGDVVLAAEQVLLDHLLVLLLLCNLGRRRVGVAHQRVDCVGLGLRDLAHGNETGEHVVHPRIRRLRILERIVVRGRLRQTCEQCRLARTELRRVLAEVSLRCVLDPVGVLAVIGDVQILVQDLLLGVFAVDLLCQQRLADLAQRVFRRSLPEKRLLHKLLRDGARTLCGTPQNDVVDHRLHHTLQVEGAFRIEIAIFGGQRRLLHHGRDLPDADVVARLLVVTNLGDQSAVAIKDLDRARGLPDVIDVRQRERRIHDDARHDEDDAADHAGGDVDDAARTA